MKALFLTALPIVLTWFGFELKKAFARYQENREQRERDRRRSIPK